MKKADFIRVFYKNGQGNLIAFRGYDLKARYYRYTPERYLAILLSTPGWSVGETPQAITFRKPAGRGG